MLSRYGFTLVELSIVLVIIGLLVSGVLAGQELIRQSRIKKQVYLFLDIERAVRSFQLKYSALPGDYNRAASTFSGYAGTVLNGDNDKTVRGIQASLDPRYLRLSTEMAQFYLHLAAAELLKDLQPTGGTSYIVGQDFPANVASEMPDTGMTIFYNVSHQPLNYARGHWLWLSHYGSGSTVGQIMAGSPNRNGSSNFLSATLLSIDTKIDDGRPMTGRLTTSHDSNFLNQNTDIRTGDGTANHGSPNSACRDATNNVYINTNLTSYTHPYKPMDPGNCFAFYQLF